MTTLFDPSAYQDVLRRIDSLAPDTPRQWGKMTASQMLEHCARAVETAAGKRRSRQVLVGKLIAWMFRSSYLGSKPLPKNGPTSPDFIVHDDPDFAAARDRLKALIAEFQALGAQGCDGNVHGFFGRMSGAEWGVLQYKHLDHHLQQFGH